MLTRTERIVKEATLYGMTAPVIREEYGLTTGQVVWARTRTGTTYCVPTAPIMWFLWKTYPIDRPPYLGGPRGANWAGHAVLRLGVSESTARRVTGWFSGASTTTYRSTVWNLLEELGQAHQYWELYG